MKLGVLTAPFGGKTLKEVLEYLSGLGVTAVELGTGAFTTDHHVGVSELLNSDKKLEDFKNTLKEYKMEIAALSCHGNPVHPDKQKAKKDDDAFRNTVLLAEKLGLDTIVTFSGCPGDGIGNKPNWVTCAWPPEFGEILDYQWNEVLIPYWKEAAAFAVSHGVTKIALEMHPGFCVYNGETLLKLRAAVGDVIGANFDPSHLIWQGIDAVQSIKELKGAIYNFHAKDTKVDSANKAKNGVLDTKSYASLLDRSWIFRTVGYGNDLGYWKDIVSTLKATGYDGAITIEHEDCLMSVNEGLEKAVALLKEAIVFEQPAYMWWA